MKTILKSRRQKRGAALVEYGLIVAGVALVCVVAVSIFGHKTGQLFAAAGSVLPGAQAEDNGAIVVGKIVDTTSGEDGPITIDTTGTNSLGDNFGLTDDQLNEIVVDPAGN
jgi:Flp pilus assembly pilin Flp